jgi:pilus assembly protein TadC
MRAIIILLILGFFYFIPSIVAYNRKKRNKEAILILNLFLGWTVIGWVGALIWVLTQDAIVIESALGSQEKLPQEAS